MVSLKLSIFFMECFVLVLGYEGGDEQWPEQVVTKVSYWKR